MGNSNYLNPTFNREGAGVAGHLLEQPMKNQKKHDIKIPVSEQIESAIRREALSKWNGSKTIVATNLVLYGMDNLSHYPEIEYEDGPYCLHVKLEHDLYMRLGELATEWKVSMRKAAHRVFIEAAKKEQIIGHEEMAIGGIE